jgi:hypothetical protein
MENDLIGRAQPSSQSLIIVHKMSLVELPPFLSQLVSAKRGGLLSGGNMADVCDAKDHIRRIHEVVERRIAEQYLKDERIKALEAEVLRLRQELNELRSTVPASTDNDRLRLRPA